MTNQVKVKRKTSSPKLMAVTGCKIEENNIYDKFLHMASGK